MKDCKNFLKKIEKLKPYMIESEEDGTTKPKVYSPNYEIGRNNWPSIIVITYDKCTFSAND